MSCPFSVKIEGFLFQYAWIFVSVYMDRYGDCFHGGPMEVADESYTIKAQGGEAYDTLKCEMTYKSGNNERLCLSFKEFFISRCDVKITAYSEKSASGNAMVTFFNRLINFFLTA